MSHEWVRERSAVMPSGCWEWLLYVDRHGYGRRKGKLAHRLSYEAFVGPISPGMTVDHLCFNTRCVNPAHLQLLDASENSRQQRSALSDACKNGHSFTPDNTYMRPESAAGQRQCRACNAAAQRRYKARKKAA